MADRWSEVREIESKIVARIVEFDGTLLRPWRWPRQRRIRRELTGLQKQLDAAMARAGAARSRRSGT